MKLLNNKIIKNYLSVLLILFSIEIIFRLVMKIPIWDWAMLRVFISLNIISLVLSFFTLKLGRIATKFINLLIVLIASIYALVQAGFENYLGVFMSVGTSSQAGAVKDYITDYLNSFMWYYWLIMIPSLILLVYYLFIEPRYYRKNKEIIKKQELEWNLVTKKRLATSQLIILTSLLIFVGIFYFTLVSPKMQNKIQLKSTTALFKNPDMPNIAVSQFGVITYGLLDVKSVIDPVEAEEIYEYTDVIEDKEETDYTRKIDDTNWIEVAEKEKNSSFKNLNNYYMTRNITDKNDYTGMFKDKNLIVVMMESVTNVILNKELYPNIYKLYEEGWAFDNSYSPRNSCSTGNNEMSGMTSLFTINNYCTANIYKNNKYPESIFNLFKNKGYSTSSYHNYTEQYYRRKIIHPNMGSDHYYGVEELGIPYSNKYEEWPSDVSLMEEVLKRINTEEKFMTWITSVSSHQPYGRDSKMGNLYVDTYTKLGYSKPLARYMSKLQVFDESLGTLINGLEEKGILDDTVIVLYADHYPYGLANKTLNEYFEYDVGVNNEVDRTPFIIYNSQMESMKSDKYTSYINILPTIANLFDLDYDPRLYAGEDIFDSNYSNKVYFADGSWQDNKAFYNATNGKIKYSGSDEYTIEEIQEINRIINEKIKMSNLAIKTNYFEKLFAKIEENKNEKITEEETEEKNSSES